MRRLFVALGLLLLVSASPAAAQSRTYFGFSIGVGNAPPAPAVDIRYVERLRPRYVPGYAVYVADYSDRDMIRYGRFWYMAHNGYWYRARRNAGPFRAIDVRMVPRPVLRYYRRHGGFVDRDRYNDDYDRWRGW